MYGSVLPGPIPIVKKLWHTRGDLNGFQAYRLGVTALRPVRMSAARTSWLARSPDCTAPSSKSPTTKSIKSKGVV